MTDKKSDAETNKQSIYAMETALTALGELERQQHRAPSALAADIQRDVQALMRAQVQHTPPTSALQRALDWAGAHWWRMASMGGTAAAIPLLAGALLGYQLTSTEESMEDPASEWLSSYNTVIEPSSPNQSGESAP